MLPKGVSMAYDGLQVAVNLNGTGEAA
jgi:hypothetical protein